jgi:uncharacterized protein
LPYANCAIVDGTVAVDMVNQVWRSAVWGGMGFLVFAWLFGDITQAIGDWAPAIAIGSGVAWLVLKAQTETLLIERLPKPSALNAAAVKTAVAEAEVAVNRLATEVKDISSDGSAQQLFALRQQINQIVTEFHRDEIRLAVMGGKGVGKSTLTQLLQTQWADAVSQTLSLQDTSELFAVGSNAETAAWQVAKEADLVIFLTCGDITASELAALERLQQSYKRTILVFNKQDQYLSAEQAVILQQLRTRTQGTIAPQDVIAIATDPRPTKVRQHQADGSLQEWLEQPEPQFTALTTRLSQILVKEGKQLILASSFGQAQEVKQEAKQALHRVWRDRALPMIDQAQWIAAGTAFANPFPALDLLATAAINAQMVLDLSQRYQKKFTLDQAKVIATTMAGTMVKLGLVEISTQTIATVLKTNFITFVAGGAIQGISAAYLTRMAGLTLIEYFENDNADGKVKPALLKQIMQRVFQENQRGAFVQGFVQQAIDHFTPPTVAPAASVKTPLERPQSVELALPLPELKMPEAIEEPANLV